MWLYANTNNNNMKHIYIEFNSKFNIYYLALRKVCSCDWLNSVLYV